MTRAMRDRATRQGYLDHRYDEPTRTINEFVDDLRREFQRDDIPYVDPFCGGAGARIMNLLQDPGPKAAGNDDASGFLSIENDDPTAARLGDLLARAGLRWSQMVPWNAVPWYVAGATTGTELRTAVVPFERLVAVLPRLETVLLMGGTSQAFWRVLRREQPDIVNRLLAVPTPHPSVRGLTRGGRQPLAVGEASLLDTLGAIASRLEVQPRTEVD